MITILLSTYNGARFLPEQLASFDAQTDPDWCVLWRDDGSTDDTIAIMEEFRLRTKRCTRVAEPVGRLGPTASFLLLLQKVEGTLGSEDVVMFSDQDDVWLPEKIEKAKESLISIISSRPALYFARQKIVDMQLVPQSESRDITFNLSFPNCLSENVVAGCTIALNRKAVEIINKSTPPTNTYHDWWSQIVLCAQGGLCIYDRSMVILYRQHSNNAIGAQRNRVARAIRAVRRGPTQFMDLFYAHIEGLSANEEVLTDNARSFIFAIQNNTHSRVAMIRTLLKYRIRRQDRLSTLLFFFAAFVYADIPKPKVR